ncbi:MAG TPA: NYN domain-containing protein [Hyphomicrobiaceae bacterium]|nr:NYN domain-containing protein [Hyphomicrobiaceae bacterium]
MSNADQDNNLAVFCDFENVALGVRDAKFSKFNIQLILERLLLKGSIVAKKAYCDWDRYKEFKPTMHEAAFELIEIPHTRQSGKNSADIRMVVDALDLCYTKTHIDTFVIVSGDSDFSPLVSKLRENAKTVIGVGVKNSTSDLLMNSCDEFIFYDDLVRASSSAKSAKRPAAPRRSAAERRTDGQSGADHKPTPAENGAKDRDRHEEGLELVMEVADALFADQGGRVWGSMVKQTLKRRKPGFNERFYGFRSFSNLLEEARERGLLDLEMDERSGGYIITAIREND